MSSVREVEIKFRLNDLKAISRTLAEAGFRKISARTREVNTLYDMPKQPLRKNKAVLRLRQYGRHWTFTFKAKGVIGRHISRQEIETRVDDGQAVSAILESLGYAPWFIYEKFRSEWSDGRGLVVIDETPIGNFGEIEGPPRWIDATARRLQISPESYITSSYTQLFFEWKRKTGSRAQNMCFEPKKTRMTRSRQKSRIRTQ